MGHTKRHCYRLRDFLRASRQKAGSVQSGSSVSLATTSTNKSSSAFLFCWLLDSGASRHFVPNQSLPYNYKVFAEPKAVALASDFVTFALGSGQVNLPLHKDKFLKLDGVWFVPDLNKNILSVYRSTSVGHAIVFF